MTKIKVLIIHNKYAKYSGEERVVDSQIELLRNHGHKVITYLRNSFELEESKMGKPKAFFTGLYNPIAAKSIEKLIKNESPDLIHIHNLYPLISPYILSVIKSYNIPIVMTVHNFRLLCPNGLFFNKGKICEKCTKQGKEVHCVINNCENSIIKSTGYALRNYWARKNKYYTKNVDAFLTLSESQNSKLIQYGFDRNKCSVIPNMYSGKTIIKNQYKQGDYIGYVGRVSKEKGLDIIFDLAESLPHVKFKIAGLKNKNYDFPKTLSNVEYVGFLSDKELVRFYNNCLFTLFTSNCNETFGLSIIEAFAHRKPVISNNLGASPEIITHNKSGLIYEFNNLSDLTEKVKYLLETKNKIEEMGNSGLLKVLTDYSPETYYKNLLAVYTKLLKINQ